jgi:hypothetical protein
MGELEIVAPVLVLIAATQFAIGIVFWRLPKQ